MDLDAFFARFPGRYGLFAKNLDTGKVVGWQADHIFPSASTIKVPVMVEAYRRLETEGVGFDRRIALRPEDQVGGSGVLQDLAPGGEFTLRDLITLMITVSDNTATNLVISDLGIEAINRTIAHLGMANTRLVRLLQRLPVERTPETNRTTARDLSLLMETLAQGQVVSQAASSSMVETLKRCQGPVSIAPPADPPRWIGQCPPVVVAHKTGALDQARHDTGIVYQTAGPTYVATLLAADAPHADLAVSMSEIARRIPEWLV